MKRLNYKILIPGGIALMALLFACGKNFLNKPPLGVLYPSGLVNKAGVQGILIGAYSDLTGQGTSQGGNWGAAADGWVYGSVCADDAYKGSTSSDQGDIINLMQWDAVTNNPFLGQKWAAMYDGIQRANDVLRTMRTVTDLAPADTVEFRAEALFLRGFFHFELRKVFWYPPFVDESVTPANNNLNVPNYNAGGYIEIWPNIESDFTYAMNNLPETQPYKGQANKWAAEAFLAKAYMFEGKFTEAKVLLDELIAKGVTASGAPYALQTNYAQNFNPNPSAKNTSESVFAIQMEVNDGSSNANVGGKAYGDNLNFPYGGGPGACCGFDNPGQDVADAFKTDANGLPMPISTFNLAPHVSDQTPSTYTGNVDPRIDITMGRLGVQYLDWGPMPGDVWIRSPGDDGHFVPKKNVYAKSVQGSLSDASAFWANVETDAVNINLIRFSDILLWDAECAAVAGDLTTAETNVNIVRTRAANTIYWVTTNGTFDAGAYVYAGGTVYADKYKISPYPAGYFSSKTIAMNAIIMERRIEFAEEGHRFFDLQRWQIPGNPILPANYMTTTLNAFAAIEAPLHPAQYQGVTFTTGKSEYFPIPQGQIDAQNSGGTVTLKQIPGY
jgi:starch-binding outer membrane protein, SusD/RagB family